MITKIGIRNFQCHRSLTIDLDEFVTVIVGPSDSGKSAIIRAIRWLCLNQPSGDSFICDGTDSVTARMKVDGRTVTRHRDKSDNLYKLGKDEFKSFGSSVPAPIERLLNIGPVNFQQQHDPPYWLSNSAGQVSRELNAIVNLEVIDSVLSAVAKQITKSRNEVGFIEERLSKAETEVKDTEWAEDAESDLKRLDKARSEHARQVVRVAHFRDVVEEAIERRETHQQASKQASALRTVVSAGKMLRKLGKRRKGLDELLGQIASKEVIEAPDITRLGGLKEICKTRSQAAVGLASLLIDIQECHEKVNWKKSDYVAAKDRLRKETDGKCPICGSSYKGDL
ncbi:hypothetical protein LCGC14_0248640 [marine sediment metagenome]|uniref:Rad50/SbcC-type AAA domain-containing protein n=1 Tax=marine sediment metagenome TaxID=412755 RepID=A0A0F9ULJ2_9ZZZZ